jgi:hypothetical protein
MKDTRMDLQFPVLLQLLLLLVDVFLRKERSFKYFEVKWHRTKNFRRIVVEVIFKETQEI